MAVIKVPKTPRKSFNPDRRPSALLLDQIRHLEWAALPAAQRTHDLPKETVKTEGAAAERIAQLTTLIREQQARPYTPGEVARVTLPPLPGTRPARESARAQKARPAVRRKKAPRRRVARKAATRPGKAARPATRSAKASSARKRGNRGRKAR